MLDILERACMSNCKPCTTLIDTSGKVSSDGSLVANATDYHTLVGACSISHSPALTLPMAFSKCLFMHDPREPHLALVKRLLRYV
jgi:hypothetical protein